MSELERITAICQKFFDESEYLKNWDEVAKIYMPYSTKKVFQIFKSHCPRCNVKVRLFQIMVKALNSQGLACGKAKVLPIQEFPGTAMYQEDAGHLYLDVCRNEHEFGELTMIGYHTYSLPHCHPLVLN